MALFGFPVRYDLVAITSHPQVLGASSVQKSTIPTTKMLVSLKGFQSVYSTSETETPTASGLLV